MGHGDGVQATAIVGPGAGACNGDRRGIPNRNVWSVGMTETSDREDQRLKLVVLDGEDLEVVGALLHDGEVTTGDMAYLPAQGRFALVVSRFDWPAALDRRFERCKTGLHFERVRRVTRNGVALGEPDRTLHLLTITFTAGDAPAGAVLLSFVEGGQIRLEVECLEAEMRDIGPRWTVEGRPSLPLAPASSPSP